MPERPDPNGSGERLFLDGFLILHMNGWLGCKFLIFLVLKILAFQFILSMQEMKISKMLTNIEERLERDESKLLENS